MSLVTEINQYYTDGGTASPDPTTVVDTLCLLSIWPPHWLSRRPVKIGQTQCCSYNATSPCAIQRASRTDNPLRNSHRIYPLNQIHSAITVTSSALYVA